MVAAVPKTPAAAGRVLKSRPLAIGHGVENIEARYLDQATRFNRRVRIHRRKVVPALAKGELVGDATPTRALAFPGAAARGAALGMAAPPPPLVLAYSQQLSGLTTAEAASHVCEPSVAMSGQVIFGTGNWFACVSTDGGSTFKYVNPYTSFPDPPGSGFCCDQVVLYSPESDLFFWLLQYMEDASGENVQRIAYATMAEVAAGRWRYFDISSAALGLKGAWLDFPDLSLSQACLYMTTNAFKGNNWVATAIARVSLASIASGPIQADKILSKNTDLWNFRVAQNLSSVAYWATHNTNSRIRVYSWPETDAAASSFDVDVPSWNEGQPYKSKTPDGRHWLRRTDGRMTGGTQAGQEIFFAWTAGHGGVNARPHPYVQIARIDIPSKSLVESINLWDPDSAIACAALGANSRNEVGVAYCMAGDTRFPTHVVGILTDPAVYQPTFTGQRGPTNHEWGDYLAVRRGQPAQDQFIASGYTLPKAAGSNDSIPNFTVFSR